jgi:hypothetical protein
VWKGTLARVEITSILEEDTVVKSIGISSK